MLDLKREVQHKQLHAQFIKLPTSLVSFVYTHREKDRTYDNFWWYIFLESRNGDQLKAKGKKL